MYNIELLNTEEYRKKIWNGEDYKKYPIIDLICRLESAYDALDWEMLRLLAHGCLVNKDIALLKRIYKIASGNILYPTAHGYNSESLKRMIKNDFCQPGSLENMSYEELVTYWNDRVKELCRRVLAEVARSAVLLQKRGYELEDIIDEMAVFPDEMVRLALCGVIDDPSRFLIDEDERVAKVAGIRADFEEKWHHWYHDLAWKKEVVFLQTALKYGLITCIDGLTGEEDKMHAKFESPLFEPILDQSVYFEFDRDIFWTIEDKRILADTILELLKCGRLKYRSDVVQTEQYLSRTRAKKLENEENN